jgi:hypothetical protein
MKPLRLLTLLILVIISWGIHSQKNIKIKLKINLIPIENRYGNLKNCSIKIYRNNVELQNFKLKGNRVKKIITTRGIYKFEFSKDSYVSKHFIIDAIDIPKNKKRHKLKAEITLFHDSKNDDVTFLKTEPISIAYYDYIKKEIRWDFEYYRGVVEKIIKAQIGN